MKVPVAMSAGELDARVREAEILGKPPRVDPVSVRDLSPDARQLVTDIRASIGLPDTDDIPEYCLVMVKRPDLFRCQLEMGTAIFKGEIPPRERELAVLRIGWLLQAPFEWGEHVDIAKRYGVTAEEIERITHGSAAVGWSGHESTILRTVEEMLSFQLVSDEIWTRLASVWSESQLIEFAVLVGHFVAIAVLQNTLRVRLATDNPGLTYR